MHPSANCAGTVPRRGGCGDVIRDRSGMIHSTGMQLHLRVKSVRLKLDANAVDFLNTRAT